MDIFKTYESWTTERVLRHVMYWTAWSLFYVTFNSLNKDHSFMQWLGFELCVLPVKITSTVVVAYYLMPKYLFKDKVWQFLIIAFLTFAFFGVILYLVYFYIVYPHVLLLDGLTFYSSKIVYKGIELIHIASLFICFKFFQHILIQRQNNTELQKMADEAQLNYLKNQVQPHFLFNTLNNIYGMILSNDNKSAETVLKLSDMMSYMLYEIDGDFVSLKKEIAHIRSYLQIEDIRYHRKLDLEVDIEEVDSELKIAPMMLIPFIENAFKHGPAKEEGRSLIKIFLAVRDQSLNFKISNTYNQTEIDPTIKSGIGLENVKKRLDLIYPDAYDLIVDKTEMFSVNLTIELTYE